MKKTSAIILGAIFTAALAACNNEPKDEWIVGERTQKDTTINGQPYRFHGGLWYLLVANMINPGRYHGASLQSISTPGYKPAMRTRGFGRSARTVSS